MKSTNPRTGTILIVTVSAAVGILVFLILSGTLIQGFSPLADATSFSRYGSFAYFTNRLPYETTEVSYNMDEMYNTTHLYDFSGKKHFAVKPSTLQHDSGKYGRSLKWPGGLIVGEDLAITGTSFTIGAWVYPTSDTLLALAGCEGIYPVIYRAANGSMLYQYSGGFASLYSTQPVDLNTWTHVALVYDADSNTAKWFLNANEQGSDEVGARSWNGKWAIGGMRPGILTYEWKGSIDEFRIYRGRALKQEEIQEDMNTSIGYKVLLTGLIADSDVAQLSYPEGNEFAEMYMLEEAADANGRVEFSVYSFSGRNSRFNAVMTVIRYGQAYSSPVLEFSWGDVYAFSAKNWFSTTIAAALLAAFIIVIPPVIVVFVHRRRLKRSAS